MASYSESFSHKVILVICFMFVFSIGIRNAKSEPATVSDIYSVRRIYQTRNHNLASATATIDAITSIPSNPETPLYFLLLNVWSRYTGRDLFTMRLLSVMFGMIALAFTYRVARLAGSHDVALDSALVACFLAFPLFYTQIARMYALLLVVSPWLVFSYWRALTASEGKLRTALLSLVASATAVIYSHLFGFFLLAAICLYHVLFVPTSRRWLAIWFAILVAALLFVPWLPMPLKALGVVGSAVDDGVLSFFEALPAILSVYSNGLPLLFPVVASLVLIRFRHLPQSQRYIVILTLLLTALLLAANAVAPYLSAIRMRYTLILAAAFSCTLAIGLNMLPKWRQLRIAALICWIAAFFGYWDSEDIGIYNNQLKLRHDDVPNYQYLIYEPTISPRSSDFVLSFHQDAPYRSKHRLHYYGNMTGSWRGIIQFWNSNPDDVGILSTDARYDDLESMTHWSFPIWAIHDPQRTDPQAMPAYLSSFVPLFHSCGRYLDTADTVVDLYVKRSITCALLTSEQPFQLRFDNGTELENILIEPENNALKVYFWWTKTFANKYAFSIQLFDSQDQKAAQLDDVVGGDPLHVYSMALSALAPGDYTVKLILYDFETGSGQAGTIVADERPFERAVDVGRISISGESTG